MERREPDDSYRHVLKYTGVFGGVQVLKIFVTIVRNKLTAKLLGKVGMGLNAIFANIADLIHSITNFGISLYAVQHVSELYEEGTDDKLRRFVGAVRTWSVISSLLGFLLCLCFSWLLNRFYFSADPRYTFDIMVLSLFVASLPIEAAECSILKGMRRLRTVAVIEILSALSTFLFTVPVYFLFGIRGVVYSLVLCGWSVALIHLYFSTQIYRYRIHLFTPSVLREGWPFIRVGVPYVLAAVLGTATTALVFNFLEDLGETGLYKAGYSLMVTYAGMVFVAVEADYFPRLSSVNHDTVRLNHTINQQIDVCVLLMAPMMILFSLAMPAVVRLLWTGEFLPVVPMAVCAVFYMFFKAITTPIAYTSLAKGDSWLYLIMEFFYDVVFVLLLRYGYSRMGLLGTGLALSVAALFDLLMVGTVYGFYYKFRLRGKTLSLILPQALLLIATVLLCLFVPPLYRYAGGILCLFLSLGFSWRQLSPEIPIVQKIRRKLRLQ